MLAASICVYIALGGCELGVPEEVLGEDGVGLARHEAARAVAYPVELDSERSEQLGVLGVLRTPDLEFVVADGAVDRRAYHR